MGHALHVPQPAQARQSSVRADRRRPTTFTERGINDPHVQHHHTDFNRYSDRLLAIYQLPPGSEPRSLSDGGDGGVWFASPGRPMIGRLNRYNGVVEMHTLPPGVSPTALRTTPHSGIWIADQAGGQLLLFEPESGHLKGFRMPDELKPTGVALVPDYVLFRGAGRFGELNPASGDTRLWNSKSAFDDGQLLDPIPGTPLSDSKYSDGTTAGPWRHLEVFKQGRFIKLESGYGLTSITDSTGFVPDYFAGDLAAAYWMADGEMLFGRTEDRRVRFSVRIPRGHISSIEGARPNFDAWVAQAALNRIVHVRARPDLTRPPSP